MGEWMDECMDDDEWMDECICSYTHEQIGIRNAKQNVGYVNGWMPTEQQVIQRSRDR